jgi:hypothetical protein
MMRRSSQAERATTKPVVDLEREKAFKEQLSTFEDTVFPDIQE